MTKQILFALSLLITLGVFGYTVRRLAGFFSLTRADFPVRDIGKRIKVTLEVAIGQTKIFRRPVIGFVHALVFWGFCVILAGSIEMVIDGLAGTERILGKLGLFYDIIIASGDVFAFIIAVAIIIFLSRRLFIKVSRFEGIEMGRRSHIDANIALTMILLLMLSLIGMNGAYVAGIKFSGRELIGFYPVGQVVSELFMGGNPGGIHSWYEGFWWTHILLIFIFANMLPYSKHFHVFLSVPNVFLSRLTPLGKLPNMDAVTREVKMMLNPSLVEADPDTGTGPERFGVKDAEDATWKNYLDSLACTQCGRCTSVCPANITGKRLSPRKIMMDLRQRMNEKGPGLLKKGRDYNDSRSLVRDYITEEELWACTTCNACARECPININHPTFIVDMRRYLVMEEGSAPGEIKAIFSNIENNGAPWQYPADDRMVWAKDLEINEES